MIVESYIEAILADVDTWPKWMVDRACPRGAWKLHFTSHLFFDRGISDCQRHSALAYASKELATMTARQSYRLATSKRGEDGSPSLPKPSGYSFEQVIYYEWSVPAKERERLRRLGESLQHLLGRDFGHASLVIQEELPDRSKSVTWWGGEASALLIDEKDMTQVKWIRSQHPDVCECTTVTATFHARTWIS